MVHEADEGDACDHATYEDHVEEVSAVGEGVDDVPEDSAAICKLKAGIVAA